MLMLVLRWRLNISINLLGTHRGPILVEFHHWVIPWVFITGQVRGVLMAAASVALIPFMRPFTLRPLLDNWILLWCTSVIHVTSQAYQLLSQIWTFSQVLMTQLLVEAELFFFLCGHIYLVLCLPVLFLFLCNSLQFRSHLLYDAILLYDLFPQMYGLLSLLDLEPLILF